MQVTAETNKLIAGENFLKFARHGAWSHLFPIFLVFFQALRLLEALDARSINTFTTPDPLLLKSLQTLTLIGNVKTSGARTWTIAFWIAPHEEQGTLVLNFYIRSQCSATSCS